MTDRVPATDSSVSWPQHGYSYCTVLPAGREYVQLLRRRDGAGDDEPDELLLDVNELAGRRRTTWSWGCGTVSPDSLVAGLLGGLRRRRGLRAAVPRPGLGSGPGGRRAALGARRRLVGGLGVLLLPGARRACGGSTRSGGTGSARPPPRTSWCWRSPDEQFELMLHAVPHRRAGGHLVGEPGHQRGLGRSTPRDPTSAAAVGRRPPPRGRVPRRARAVRRRLRRAAARDQRRGDRVPAGALPGAALGRPGLVRVAAAATRGPGRAARAGRRVRRPRGAHLARRRPQPAADPAARRPHRRGHRGPARSPTSRRSWRPTTATSSTTWTGSSSWTSPT